MITRYDAAYYAFSPLLVSYLALRWARRRKYRQSAPAMLGRALGGQVEADRFLHGSVWVHAVSVGEVAAARAVEPHLRGAFADLPLVLSTITETGQEAARESVPGAEAHTYFPADLSWNVRRFLRFYRPRYVILMETEIWPNFLTMAAASGAKIFMINARMSDRSFPKYRAGRRFLAPAFRSIRGFCAQTEVDRDRFAAMGIAPERIEVTGNCKLDLKTPTLTEDERRDLRAELGIGAERPVLVAGSTHGGEEEIILEAFARLREEIPDLCLLLAPRHVERSDEVQALVSRRGLEVSRVTLRGEASALSDPDRVQVVVLDKMGMLARAYGVGEVAIVAGSFGATGGHNLLEAAAHGVPVVYGPNMKNQRELVRLFEVAGAGTRVGVGGAGEASSGAGDMAANLAGVVAPFYSDPELRRVEGEKARSVLEANQGSAGRSIEAIKAWLEADAEAGRVLHE